MLWGGDVRTMDPSRPTATALAIKGETIIAVGDDAAMRLLAGPRTKYIALEGKTVTPGLVDAHCHLYGLGLDLESINVRALPSAADTAKAVAEAAKTRGTGEWLTGRGWDQNRWPGQQFPTKAALDAVLPDRPVALRRIDGHAVWVNSAALAAAKITAATPDPAGGKIIRDGKGEPTGVLVDNAIDLIDAVIPAPTAEVRERRIRTAAKEAIAVGLTGVHEMGIEDATADVYRKLAETNQLPLRVYAFYAGDASKLERLRQAPAPAVGRFQMRAVKFFADGALGSRGARLYEPYSDDPTNKGLWVTEPDKLALAVDVATSAGWQIGIHAIGDAAIGSVLDAYLAAQKKHGGDRRHRVEHLQVLALDDLQRLIDSKAIASLQPTHATSDMPWAEQRVGPKRIEGAYAWRTLIEKGVPIAAGSDFPVEEVSPMLGIYSAVTRQDVKGQPPDGWYPKQRMSLDEAIAAFTRGAAYAEFAETSRGMLAAGRAADVTVFGGVLVPDRSLLEKKVAATIVGGTIVFEQPGALRRAAP